jgi:hypothetical protein
MVSCTCGAFAAAVLFEVSDGLLGLLSLCFAQLFLLSNCCVGILLLVFLSASAALFEIDRCIIPIEQKHLSVFVIFRVIHLYMAPFRITLL